MRASCRNTYAKRVTDDGCLVLFSYAVVLDENKTASLNTRSKFVSLPFYRLQLWDILNVVGMFTLIKYFADGIARPGQCTPIMY